MNAITQIMGTSHRVPHVSTVARELTLERIHEALENCGSGFITDSLFFGALGVQPITLRIYIRDLRKMGYNVVRVRPSWDSASGGYRLERGKAVGVEIPEVAV